MTVWFAIPSARPAAEAERRLSVWRRQGYRIALLRQGEPLEADFQISTDVYLGWANSTNILARQIMQQDPDAQWIVGGGDDYVPDPAHTAQQIAEQTTEYFRSLWYDRLDCQRAAYWHNPPAWVAHSTAVQLATFGVMQPTGDRWGSSPGHAYIDGIAGSPWMGREWCRRAYRGQGPLWGEYLHMFGDEELQCVATLLGAFQQRRDLIQLHEHWGRERGGRPPEFLKPVNSPQHWTESSRLFQQRKRAGFPFHEPIP